MPGHVYHARVQWSGSTAAGYRAYSRAHTAYALPARQRLDLSADPHFHGDADLPNPEQLLVLAASSCQLLSFLALAARRHVDVLGYADDAEGLMPPDAVPQRITRITLRPSIRVSPDTDAAVVDRLVHEAHEQCYIANSLSSEIVIDATIAVGGRR